MNYRDSTGRAHVIEDMANGYLHAALAKLMRGDPTRVDEIEEMTRVAVKRAEAENYQAMTTPNLLIRREQMRASPWVASLELPLAMVAAILIERGVG